MALLELNRTPSKRELGVFGIVILVFFGIVGGLIVARVGSWRAAGTLWGIGLAVTLVYAAVPALRLPTYMLWMRAVYPIGWVVSHLLLAVVFYGMITLVGLLMRALGRDPIQRRLDRRAPSYWSPMAPVRGVSDYFRQS